MLKIPALEKLSKKLPKLSAAWRWSLIVAFIALGMVGIWMYVSKQQAAKEAAAKQQLIAAIKIKTVTALGTLEPQGEIVKLSAPTSIDGVKIERLLVQEGDTVKTGQVIAILDSRGRLEAALDEAKAKVSVAQASLVKIKAGAKQGEINAQKATITRLQAERVTEIESLQATLARVIAETQTQTAVQIGAIAEAQAGLVNAQAENKRYADLTRQGAVSRSTGDSKQLALQTSQQRVNQARSNLARIQSSGKQQINEARANLRKTETSMYQQIREGQFTLNKIAEVRPVDVMSAEADIKSAIATQKTAAESLAKAYIRSPLNGQIFKIFSHPGEVVSTTDGVADIGKTSQMYGVVEVYNSDANKIRAGQQVKLTSSSLSGELRGTVERIGTYIKRQDVINADPTSNIDNRVIEVHVILDPASSKRAANFTNLQVQAVIELNS
jgi:HlyD family secretion protein